MVVFAVGMCRRMMGLRGATAPRFITHSVAVEASDATSVAEWVGLRPGRTSRGALRRGRAWVSGCGACLPERLTGDQHGVHDDGEFAGNGDRGTFEAKPLTQLQPPFAQVALGSAADQQHGCGFI